MRQEALIYSQSAGLARLRIYSGTLLSPAPCVLLLGDYVPLPAEGSWEPLLARASHLEELEHLRADFAQQQQQERAQHESELEHLRVYFEKKLKDAEKTYQEDLTLFQQRLQEAREDSLESAEIR